MYGLQVSAAGLRSAAAEPSAATAEPQLPTVDPASTLPFVIVLVAVVGGLFLARWLLDRWVERSAPFRQPLIMAVLTFAGLVAIVVFLPIREQSLKVQLIQLLGVLLSGSIALSSTTLLGNAVAGVMMRVVAGFRTGDYIRVGEHVGRVSERGLFHTEIQTEDRDLVTLPNIYMVSKPVQVARASGTVVSAEVSLGYDVSRRQIDRLLKSACEKAGLSEPFVQVLELGDFSVVYRAAGLLEDVKQIISARSRIREAVMDELHEAGVEIVSPNFMNTRALEPGARFVPPAERVVVVEEAPAASPENVVFDKAEHAETLVDLKQRLAEVEVEMKAAQKELQAAGEEQRGAREARLAALASEHEALLVEVARMEDSPNVG